MAREGIKLLGRGAKKLPASTTSQRLFPQTIPSLELHPSRPKDIPGDQTTVACSSVVEEGGIPLLGELHGHANSRGEEVPDRGGAPGTEAWAGSPQIAGLA